ncbi:MAG: hypothetical protein J7641_15440 [Cyanobacteria bacterium SID2]|nr:hypothetical protein [Cyanobacteria bacterium SID2]MBP0004432.1 hypothetical protein [Cyanobacteria bacterium SBC]
MEQWEFSIQRDGDRVWIPVRGEGESLDAGRYRIVARTTLANAMAEVGVLYTPGNGAGASKQFYKRARQTDEDGSLVVLPPTDLLPGQWEFSCAAPISPDRPTPIQRATVRLQVLSREEPDGEPEALASASVLPTFPEVLGLRLDRENYAVKSQEPLVLSGRIELPADCEREVLLQGLHVRLRLREPQSLRIVVARQRLLPAGRTPFEFSFSIPIPDTCNSRLILGEVLLCDAVPNVLSKQSFTVAVRLETLLDAMAEGQINESLVDRSPVAPAPYRSPKRPEPPQPKPPDPAVAEVLPPQLGGQSSKPTKAIDLPTFGKPIPPAPSDLDEPPTPGESIEGDAPAPLATPEPTSLQASSVDRAFQSLDLQNRFASRLNDLAKDEDLSAWLASGAERRENPFQLSESEPPLSEWESREIVVDDESIVPVEPKSSVVSNFSTNRSRQSTISEEQPLPTPELVVPTGNLTVERPIVVKARLPQMPTRVFVKLWIYDRQNQALLDGPRWLTDFFAIEGGQMETAIQLSIPRGGLEIQFEAVSVEMETERESYKVTVSRRAFPAVTPTLPSLQPSAEFGNGNG